MQGYDERLAAPLWWWPAGLGAAAAAAYVVPRGEAVHGIDVVAWEIGLFTLLAAPVLAFLLTAARARVRVTDGVLDAAGRRLPVAEIDTVTPLDAAATRRRLGREADPRAVVVQRFWVHTAVEIATAGDPGAAPYWLVSTRHPDRIAAAIAAELSAAPR